LVNMMNWISIEDDIPPDGLVVMCCDVINEFISLGIYVESDECFHMMHVKQMESDSQVTHWMYLPELPEFGTFWSTL